MIQFSTQFELESLDSFYTATQKSILYWQYLSYGVLIQG